MTKSEIAQCLYLCSNGKCSAECPYFSESKNFCVNVLMKDALEIIIQQDRELIKLYNTGDYK